MINLGKESSREDALASQLVRAYDGRRMTQGQKAAKKIVDRVNAEGHVLVTPTPAFNHMPMPW